MIERGTTVVDMVVDVVGIDTVARIGLGANERSAVINARAISDTGAELVARGIGLYVPEVGWTVHSACDAGCEMEMHNELQLDFSITDPGTWAIHMRIMFVYESA